MYINVLWKQEDAVLNNQLKPIMNIWYVELLILATSKGK